MSAASRAMAGFRSFVQWHDKPLSEPEPVYGTPREPVGIFGTLSPEKQKAVLGYRGPQDHGDAAFLRKRHP